MQFVAILLLQAAPAPARTSLDAALPPALAGWTRTAHGDINDLTTPASLAAISLWPGLYQLTLTRLTKPRIKVMLVAGK